jgi:hypothetical protein
VELPRLQAWVPDGNNTNYRMYQVGRFGGKGDKVQLGAPNLSSKGKTLDFFFFFNLYNLVSTWT